MVSRTSRVDEDFSSQARIWPFRSWADFLAPRRKVVSLDAVVVYGIHGASRPGCHRTGNPCVLGATGSSELSTRVTSSCITQESGIGGSDVQEIYRFASMLSNWKTLNMISSSGRRCSTRYDFRSWIGPRFANLSRGHESPVNCHLMRSARRSFSSS